MHDALSITERVTERYCANQNTYKGKRKLSEVEEDWRAERILENKVLSRAKERDTLVTLKQQHGHMEETDLRTYM